jgi:NAD(P)-dependent dehydrogenase (short-subunit alcohol dehydrogenase family)
MALLTGKTAVITGGSTGIGLATAKRFVEEGASYEVEFAPSHAPVIVRGACRKTIDQMAGELKAWH